MSGHRITHLDVAWYQKGKKKPIGYTTQADADFYKHQGRKPTTLEWWDE